MTTAASLEQNPEGQVVPSPTSSPPPPSQTRPVVLVAWTLIALQVSLVSWAALRGWFYGDDLAIRGQGATYAWLDPEYLLQPWGGHFMPAAFAVAQVFSRLGNFGYAAIAISLSLGQAFVAIAFWRLLLRHFGARWRILVPLALYLISIPVLQATVWWASALNSLPYLACLVLAVDRALRLSRRPSLRDVVWLWSLTVVALGFFEKAVLLPVVIFFVLLATTPGRNGRLSAVTVVSRHRMLFAGFSVVYVAWLVAYTRSTTSTFAIVPSWETLREQFRSGLVGTFLPSLVGGPWDWAAPASAYSSLPANTTVGAFVGGVLLVLGAVLITRGSRVVAALLMVGAYAMGLVALLAIGRTQFMFPDSGLPRYFADLTVVFAVAAALMTCRLVADPAPEMLDEISPRPTRRLVVAAAVAFNLVVVSWVLAGASLGSSLPDTRVLDWTTTATATARSDQSSSPILSGTVPGTVMSPLLFPYHHYSWFFAGTNGIPPVASSTDELRSFDRAGRLRPAHVVGPSALQGPVPDCGRRVGSDVTWIPMENEIVDYTHTMRVSYLSGEATGLEVALTTGDVVTVTLRKGYADVYLSIVGGGSAVSLRATDPDVVVCVSDVTIGSVAPGPAPASTS